jgi:peptidyl-prolyl cis-trans isomerase C
MTVSKRSSLKAIIREPLLHFLLLGSGLFALYSHVQPSAGYGGLRTIVVDQDKLMTYVERRSRVFDAEHSRELLGSLGQNELKNLIRDYVREEALYREAKALQLDKNDDVERLRLIQKLEFVTRGFADTRVKLNNEQLTSYYLAHLEQYRVPPNVTFTHVFFSSERHGLARAEALAWTKLRELNRARVPFDRAPAYGERFLYGTNYVKSEPAEVASHFGERMERELFALSPSEGIWRGPFQSAHGFHLVQLISREEGYQPALEEVRARVEQQAHEDAVETRLKTTLDQMIGQYSVHIEPIDVKVKERGAKAPS